jgi:hypothetical protein
VILNKIVLQLSMNLSVLNALMRNNESLYHVCIMFWLSRIPIGDVLKVLCQVTLIFNDNVMQYDKCVIISFVIEPLVSNTQQGHE